MNDELTDESFADSLLHLTPNVPEAIKARLLYECGFSAARASIRRRQWSDRLGVAAAILVAFGIGMFTNQQPPDQFDKSRIATVEAEPSQPEPQGERHHVMLARNLTTLTAAMPLDQVDALLDGDLTHAASIDVDPPTPTRAFGTLFYPHDLN